MKIIWKKKSKWPWEITTRFLRRGERRKAVGYKVVFCQNLGIATYTLENYSNFKSKFSFDNGSIFETNDYFRTWWNASFNDFSQLINTLLNQGFAGLDELNKLENLFCTQGVARKLNWCSLKKENCRKKRSFNIIKLSKTSLNF